MARAATLKMEPAPHVFREKIGDLEWLLEEKDLDVMSDVVLWEGNPRLRTVLPSSDAPSQLVLERTLQQTKGYDALKVSIAEIGQMEPIYVWRPNRASKYLVLEGATRVTILRDLTRKNKGGKKDGVHRRVKVKVLPTNFGKRERAILLARIHVRGSGVRDWGRYVEAKFIHDTIEGHGNEPALMTATELARQMGKSIAWVTRLRDAYTFGRHFVEHIDSPDAEQQAVKYFSILEEVSKAPSVGPKLREYDNKKNNSLRSDVFEMVRNEAFKEYRDARFMKDFYEDQDKWVQLKSGERHIANKLALEVKTNSHSMKARIASLEKQVQRAIERSSGELDEEDADILQRCVQQIEDQVHTGVPQFQLKLRRITEMLNDASRADAKALTTSDITDFRDAVEYFEAILARRSKAAA